MSSSQEALNNRIYMVWKEYQAGNKEIIEEIYPDLISFSLRVASKTCNRYVAMQDEEAGIAQMSILEAFDKYDPEKGAFYPFLGRVVRNRLIDFRRKENRIKNIPFSNLGDNEDDFPDVIDDSFFNTVIDDMARQQEIEMFKHLLAEYKITFEELIKVSPKQMAVREKVKQIVWLITSEYKLKTYLLDKKVLPAAILQNQFHVNHKILDRYRKYIIAGVLILNYEFTFLKPYIIPQNRGDNE